MASPNNTGIIPSTRRKGPVLDTSYQSQPRLQTDVLITSPVGYASAEESRLHQSSPVLREPSPVSPLSAHGSLADFLWKQTEEGDQEELSFQASVEKGLKETTHWLEEPRVQMSEKQEQANESLQQVDFSLDSGKSTFRGSMPKNKGCEKERRQPEDLEREVCFNDLDRGLYTGKTNRSQEEGGKGKGKGKGKEILPSICERLPREIIQQ